jgi:hypothetical protein
MMGAGDGDESKGKVARVFLLLFWGRKEFG